MILDLPVPQSDLFSIYCIIVRHFLVTPFTKTENSINHSSKSNLFIRLKHLKSAFVDPCSMFIFTIISALFEDSNIIRKVRLVITAATTLTFFAVFIFSAATSFVDVLNTAFIHGILCKTANVRSFM